MIKFWLSCPHRLAAQDVALSRLKRGFESRWGHHKPPMSGGSFVKTQRPIEGCYSSPAGGTTNRLKTAAFLLNLVPHKWILLKSIKLIFSITRLLSVVYNRCYSGFIKGYYS